MHHQCAVSCSWKCCSVSLCLPHHISIISIWGRNEGNVLFNKTLNTFYLRFYGIRHMVKNHSDFERGNLLPHGLFFLCAARVILYAPSHRQDSTNHSLCYTNRGALAGMRNSSVSPLWGIDPKSDCTIGKRSSTVLYPASENAGQFHTLFQYLNPFECLFICLLSYLFT